MSGEQPLGDAYDWYRRNFPKGPEYAPRLFEVLRALAHNGQIYNVSRTCKSRPDGGFRPFGTEGVFIRMYGEVATFDGGEMTRLVVAAHRHCCRVSVSATGGSLQVAVTPRQPGAGSNYLRHPNLLDLAVKCVDGDDHYLNFTDTGWFIEHSLKCRVSGEMAKGCKWQREVEGIEDVVGHGRWLMGTDEDGFVTYTDASVAA